MVGKFLFCLMVLVGLALADLKLGDPNTVCRTSLSQNVVSYTTQGKIVTTRQVLEDAPKPCNLSVWYIKFYEKEGRPLPQECDKNADPILVKTYVTKYDSKYHVEQKTRLGDFYCVNNDIGCASGYMLSDVGSVCTLRPTTTTSTRPPRRTVPRERTTKRYRPQPPRPTRKSFFKILGDFIFG